MAQPDPRDYVLVPLEEFVAENEDLAPRFRSAAEQVTMKLRYDYKLLKITLPILLSLFLRSSHISQKNAAARVKVS